MEPITLITTALTLATPYLIKSGEKLAEGIGEDVWAWIKKPFTTDDEKEIISNFQIDEDSEKLKAILLEKINQDIVFKQEFEKAVNIAQEASNEYYQQNIHNNGNIEKQINIQENSGNIQM